MLVEAHPSLLSQLRAATISRHASLDSKLALLEGALSQERYEAFLRGSLTALLPQEEALAPWVTSSISRTSLILADLASLGAEPRVAAVLPAVPIQNVAHAFGARYVIEGSALGGAVLARAFQKALNLGPGSLRYLTIHGDRPGEHWRAFLFELEAWSKSATATARSEACDAARAVFDLYQAAFEIAGALSPSS